MNLLKISLHKIILVSLSIVINTNCKGQNTSIEIYDMAYTAYEESKYEDAIPLFESINESFKDSVDYHLLLGICQSEVGDNAAAIESYANCISLDPNYDYVYLQRGISYFSINENEKAIEDFNKAISISPENPEFYLNLGTVIYDTGDKDEACKAWKKASDLGMGIAEQMIEQVCK